MVTFYHKVQLVQDISVMPASYSHKPKTNGTHCSLCFISNIYDFHHLFMLFNYVNNKKNNKKREKP